MIESMIPVVMCGGNGTRLWPLSRKQYPKQFLKIEGDLSLLQRSVQRVAHLAPPVMVCANDHRFLVAGQMDELGCDTAQIILEPCARETAPAMAVAALSVLSREKGDPVLLMMPSDQVIGDGDAFTRNLERARALAEQGDIVLFGIAPDRPETQFGYIHVSEQAPQLVSRFVEKPDAQTAQRYLESGEYLWNSGIVVCRASSYLTALHKLNPEMLSHCRKAIKKAARDLDFLRLDAQQYQQIEASSVDYTVLEHLDTLKVLTLDTPWTDLGNWDALWRHAPRDDANNALFGDVVTQDCTNSLIYSDTKLVCGLGLEDLVIVDTKDTLMVARRDRASEVKGLVAQLAAQNRVEHAENREVHRPWGCFDSIEQGENYQVKHLTVKPGEKLSLQMHYHRAEHWVVVSGSALVQCGEEHKMVAENESIYISKGTVHSLENPGKIPLHVIEIQSGAYLGEDDIVRFVDKYNRLQDQAS